MSNNKNQGEGDRESAKRYNEDQQEFVNSTEGKKAIDNADDINITDDMREAEEKGKEPAKGVDDQA